MRIMSQVLNSGWIIYLYPRDHNELEAFKNWLAHSLPGYDLRPDLESLQPFTCIVTGKDPSHALAIELSWR